MSKLNNHIPIVAIIGKPNVGKSSLFNRLIDRRKAIITSIAGTTRDRIFEKTHFGGIESIIVDTGGLEFEKKENIEADMHAQVQIAIKEADLVIFLVDGRAEPTANDHLTADLLRKSSKESVFVANKCDNKGDYQYLSSWAELGFGAPLGISAIHNYGSTELRKEVHEKLKKLGFERPEENKIKDDDSVKLAFIGRPNAGKSSIINAFLHDNRLIVSDIPGTTRDTVDIEFSYKDEDYILIDTAGLRRRGKIERGIEKFSAMRSAQAIEESDIVCLIMDYSAGIRAQDQHICSYALDAEKGIILIVNKIDLMEDSERERQRLINILRRRFDFLSWAPVVFTSAVKSKNILQILELAKDIAKERKRYIDHDELVLFLEETYHKHIIPVRGAKKLYVYDMKQTANCPPKFEIILNDTRLFNFSYQRYIENSFRKKFGFQGTSLEFIYKPVDPKHSRELKPL